MYPTPHHKGMVHRGQNHTRSCPTLLQRPDIRREGRNTKDIQKIFSLTSSLEPNTEEYQTDNAPGEKETETITNDSDTDSETLTADSDSDSDTIPYDEDSDSAQHRLKKMGQKYNVPNPEE